MAVEYLRSDFFPDPKAEVAVFRRRRGVACLPHFHDFCEIIFVLRGKGIHVVDNVASRFSAGDILIIKPGQIHYYRDLCEFSLVCVLIAPEALQLAEPFFRRACSNQFRLSRDGFQDALDLLRAIEDSTRTLAKRFALELVEMLGKESLIEEERLEPARFASADIESSLKPALSLLEQGFDRPIKVRDLCDASFLSERSLYRHFIAVTGRSPIVYLNDLRLHQAMLLLKRGGLRIVDVAFQVGFNDLSYFHRQFSRMTGLPPGRWQERPAQDW